MFNALGRLAVASHAGRLSHVSSLPAAALRQNPQNDLQNQSGNGRRQIQLDRKKSSLW